MTPDPACSIMYIISRVFPRLYLCKIPAALGDACGPAGVIIHAGLPCPGDVDEGGYSPSDAMFTDSRHMGTAR